MRRTLACAVMLACGTTTNEGMDSGVPDTGGPDTGSNDASTVDVREASADATADVVADVAPDVAAHDAGSLDNGLIGLWTLNETLPGTAPDGGDFADLSGFGHNGTALGGVTFGQPGVVGNAAVLNGSTGYILTGPNAPMPTGAMSVASWIKANSTQVAYPQMVTAGDTSTVTGYNLYLLSPNAAFILKEGNNAWGNCWAHASTNLQDGVWHNLVGVYSGSMIYIYVDGKLAASSACANQLINYGTSPNGEIGAKANGYGNTVFGGSIQQAAVWNRALTATEVTALYNGGTGMVLP